MKFIETLKNVWKIEELRNRILLTLGLLLVYRFGAQVVLPGIDASKLADFAGSFEDGGLGGLLNAFSMLSLTHFESAKKRLLMQIVIGAVIGVTSIKIGYISNIF